MPSVRRPRGRLFQIHGPAAPNLLSPKLLCVRGTAHMLSYLSLSLVSVCLSPYLCLFCVCISFPVPVSFPACVSFPVPVSVPVCLIMSVCHVLISCELSVQLGRWSLSSRHCERVMCDKFTWRISLFVCWGQWHTTEPAVWTLMPNIHRRRRHDETVLSHQCRRCEHNLQLAHDDCRRIQSTIWKLTRQTP